MATTPPELTTELSAVNTLLAGIGEQPVESLDAIESSLVQVALNALNEASRSLQVRGWYWNRDEDWPLSVNSAGNIPLPNGTIKVHEVRGSGDDLVQRGQRLWNKTTKSFTFDQGTTVKVDLTLMLPWDDLPEFAKHPILYVAQKRFQMRELTSNAIDRAIAEDLEWAKAQIETAEDEQGPENMFASNPSLRGTEGLRRPWYR